MSHAPNIVVITTHDTGRHLGCYGIPTVQTPTLDRLAADGCRFADYHATSAVCSPARAAAMSGLYPQNNGVMHLTHEPWLWKYKPGVKHLSHHLRDAGYHTIMFHHQHEALDINDLGFEDYRAREPEYPIGAMPDPYDHLTAGQVAEEFSQWIDDRPTDRPFFAQIGFFETHMPFDFGGNQGDDSLGLTWPEQITNRDAKAQANLIAFQGSCRIMDEAIATIAQALEAAGLTDNTIFVYTTDHGISFQKSKAYLYDTGTGIALIMRWPAGGIVGGRVIEGQASNIDLVPTLLDLAGVASQTAFDGESLRPALEGRAWSGRPAAFAEENCGGGGRESRSIRTNGWKLIRNFNPTRLSECGQDQAYVTCPTVQLFNLEEDPYEFRNLAGEPAYATVQQDLDRQLTRWLVEVDDPILQGPVQWPFYQQAAAELQEALRTP